MNRPQEKSGSGGICVCAVGGLEERVEILRDSTLKNDRRGNGRVSK